MNKTDLERYYLSILPIKRMYDLGLITKKEFNDSEKFLAEKYCINNSNLYRLNDLTIKPTRVINSVTKEEVIGNEKSNNKNRTVTRIT